MKEPNYNQFPCRIDVVAIHSQNSSEQDTIEWVKNAIEL
jgi:Holliday junction resolvase-like predicted endonuclease